MEKIEDISKQKPGRKSKINTSSDSREKVMINLAMDAVEERIKSGKASASEYVHFLKLGTEQAKLEREKLRQENKLLEAKTQSIEQSSEMKELIEKAMEVFSIYHGDVEYEDDDYEEEHTSSRRKRRRR
ncbi:MAG: hypothetical protein IKZ85_07690 [Pseudobutyrivibrio sp.]|nr:hypothetical protein [Pseudobutyrivibrio sp.]